LGWVTCRFLQVKLRYVPEHNMVPCECRKWSIPFSLVEARTEI
jgi:hypothetical protein